MTQSKTDKKESTVKVPKTIKVSTVVKGIVIFIALVASFAVGWHSNQEVQFSVNEKAHAIAQTLKVNQ